MSQYTTSSQKNKIKTAQNRSLVNAFDSDEKGDQELGRLHFKCCSLYIHISLVYTYKWITLQDI